MYSAVSFFNACAGIEITASHNPIDYNGMKIVKNRSQPLTEKEFSDIKSLAEFNKFSPVKNEELTVDKRDEARHAYLNQILSFVDLKNLKPLKIVINSGNGSAGPIIDNLRQKLESIGVKTNFVCLHHNPDPSFPNGIPNPILEENQPSTANAVEKEGAAFGVAFDGDFDRCFLFDNFGNFVSGEYVVGILAQIFLSKEKCNTIIHDRRAIWSTLDVVKRYGGNAVSSKTGHAFFKAIMRENAAIYGGETSAHHYFRDFSYCDSGMIPWLLIWEYLSKNNVLLFDLVSEQKRRFPSSGEINFTVSDAKNCIKMIKESFASNAILIDDNDGLSMSFDQWRFNVRQSNTEPLVRLNVETKGDKALLRKKTTELRNLIVNS